ncbi:hypothetical protein QVD99_003755 [Batrachochytrium dendrobatidis]|nr:hypothetical protein QVD99_006812 [Batrachochytrium dendrobatidis]KAK5669359.1 hypothetical protein QVD99_003755 [Batrachochytrium dendrobatidis]
MVQRHCIYSSIGSNSNAFWLLLSWVYVQVVVVIQYIEYIGVVDDLIVNQCWYGFALYIITEPFPGWNMSMFDVLNHIHSIWSQIWIFVDILVYILGYSG